MKTASLQTPVPVRKPGTLTEITYLELALQNTEWQIGNPDSCMEKMSMTNCHSQ